MPDSILLWLKSFIPPRNNVDRFERMRSCAGSLFGILLVGLASYAILPHEARTIWLIAPMGASAVLLFAVPSSPLAQPWSIIGGNLSAALIGISCAKLVQEPALAAALAISLAIGAMFLLRCLHPPSGAVALTAVLGGPVVHEMGYQFVLAPVGLNSVLLLLAALFFNNASGRRYPHAQQSAAPHPHQTRDELPITRLGFSHEDLDEVLKSYNQVIDIGRDDLEEIFMQTEMRAYHRRFGETRCAAVMSRDVVAVEFATSLDNAWRLLQKHRLRALPVIDRGRHVIGIVSRSDFLEHAGAQVHTGLAEQLRKLLHRVPFSHSDKPEVVGQIMSRPVISAGVDTPLLELVPRMADGLHQIPVLDAEGKLAGMLTQSDMIAALYEKNLAAARAASAGAGLRSAA
ncbi:MULTISPECIES: HPP family protein [unclassified Herbaspirillum]|uniref:HPP family protein n=1 Tax=unclassified Herbaspirillum TaxID=2624150 RepID=UPI0011505BF1|nr:MULTISPECIES: HPP family protein [unclassified Herbaspirillum]MBB5392809.1 CBS domain-containing membrane protein [Herbaspirillum sp. SJZ102]TQK04543.1 CBS domain-containing membrane protein [Herbaspirillum sp. SJZ130]TQK09671.1 CBS domain-containing membrane protein [Herbaspirillum sp. SJZ106]TWC64075.1 CBS domain-containing membrane protein [Herbaspirillum sp. SJZ099]